MTRLRLGFLVLVSALLTSSSFAQDPRTMTVRVIDSATGMPLASAHIGIWVDPQMRLGHDTDDYHWSPQHRNVVEADENGTGQLTVPPGVMTFSAHASIGPPIWGYLSCDAVKLKKTDKDPEYRFEDVFAKGVVAPNNCNNRTATAKPGEFIFFVRSLTLKEGMRL